MFSVIFAESSLELVPKKIQNHPSITAHAEKKQKSPNEILLDNSWHFAAMKGLKNEIKRGRPDIVHLCLLESCSIPLYFRNKIKVYVHTINDEIISISHNVRIPKSYHRFEGLIEKLFKEKVIKNNQKSLLQLQTTNFSKFIDKLKPKKVIGLSTEGNFSSYEKVATLLNDNVCLVIGAFQKGHFSNLIKKKIDHLFCVDKHSLEAHVIVSRILYEYEKTIFM